MVVGTTHAVTADTPSRATSTRLRADAFFRRACVISSLFHLGCIFAIAHLHSLHRPSEPLAGDHQDAHIDLDAITVSTLDEVVPAAPEPARIDRRPSIVVKDNHPSKSRSKGDASKNASAPVAARARENAPVPPTPEPAADRLEQEDFGESFTAAAASRTLLAVHTAAREALDDAMMTTTDLADHEAHADRQALQDPAVAGRETATIADTIAVSGADALGATTPLASPPSPVFHVSAGLAQALRVYDVFPSMPDAMRAAGIAAAVSVEICVTDSGNVSEVTLDTATAPALRDVLRSAIRTWRYRPLVLAGSATPFCHDMQVRYSVN
jgi:outer membrane biosynthesis protein TonB